MKITELIKKIEELMITFESMDGDLHHASSNIQDAINNISDLDTDLNTILSKLKETQKNMEVK
jgi:peptidoglycan hydrolase CwlO-like protein